MVASTAATIQAGVGMKSQRVFVSGGAGVIGLEMIPRLAARGAALFVAILSLGPEGIRLGPLSAG